MKTYTRIILSTIAIAASGLAAGGCTDADAGAGADASNEDEIRGNTGPAFAVEEAVFINAFDKRFPSRTSSAQRCSGALVAPRLVLTAGHCMQFDYDREVTAPYANGQKANVIGQVSRYEALPADPNTDRIPINFRSLDAGLFELDAPICLASYPTLASAPLPSGAQMITVGRVDNGIKDSGGLYQSQPTRPSVFASRPFYYDVPNRQTGTLLGVTEGGDSGGPSYSLDGLGFLTSTIVAVTSAGSISAMFSRVDVPEAQYLKDEIASRGRRPGDCGL